MSAEHRAAKIVGRPGRRWLLPYLIFPALMLARLPIRADLKLAGITFTLIFLLLASMGIGFSIRAASHPALPPAIRRPWRFMAAFFVLYMIAGSAFIAMIFAFGNMALLSTLMALGVGCRLVQVPILLIGLLSFATARLDGRARWKLAMDVMTVVGGALMLLWYFLLAPVLQGHRPAATIAAFTTVAFPICDLVMIVGICTVLLRGTAASVRRPLGLLLSGLFGYLVTDLGLILVAVRGPGYMLPPLAMDLALLVPAYLMVTAAVEQCRQARTIDRRAPVAASRRMRAPSWLPYVALAIGHAVLVAAAIQAGLYPWLGLVAGGLIMTFGVAVRQVITLRENYALVLTDNLTGLANRIRLQGAMARAAARARRTETLMAVLAIDLDGFKRVNDTLGHKAGDAVLVAFADVLRRNVRESDTAARLGGDEFAVVLDGVAGSAGAVAVAERILADAASPLSVGNRTLQLRASIGIAVGNPALSSTADALDDALLRRADVAMYAAKRQKAHGWQLYTEEAMRDDLSSAALRDDLLGAVSGGQLQVYYQPIVCLATGDLVSVEALVRWQHPTRGLLTPVTFIPLAEEMGVIHDIGAWVLDVACQQVRVWQDRLPEGPRLCLSVNFSALQLERPTLAAEVFEVLDRTGLNPGCLVVEVTEGVMVDGGSVVPQLTALRQGRVRVALDDFGTGYSSLRYLTQLPVDILKMDRCFVADIDGGPQRSAVAEAVIRLGQLLRLDTVAEGIENADQAIELTLLGCRTAQGYHFAQPLTAQAMDMLVGSFDGAWPNLPVTPRSATHAGDAAADAAVDAAVQRTKGHPALS
jgi:diguanylate cyclase